ncbi:uncharacterized protein SPSK_10666 [Sporothrix schenckii 1099-18]|uniref:Uncharacterized protein n=1 Tax=Sporothrix schenckii 1099-18 TaxID=1397361 RepID=A0A0F2LWB4_SPOSC|nr:uncharacterized protein SPSK_10666 [Sporothrix schenckii 1099-18]KJR80785.1 hypothetical protein SPSK_10666 [Sporothrix schenckii 1099-18]
MARGNERTEASFLAWNQDGTGFHREVPAWENGFCVLAWFDKETKKVGTPYIAIMNNEQHSTAGRKVAVSVHRYAQDILQSTWARRSNRSLLLFVCWNGPSSAPKKE